MLQACPWCCPSARTDTLLPFNTDLLKNSFLCWWLKEGVQVTCPREPSSGQALYLNASNSAWLLLLCIFLSSHKGRALKKMVLHCYVNIISASQDDREETHNSISIFTYWAHFTWNTQLMLCLGCIHLYSMTPLRSKVSIIKFIQQFNHG